MRYAFIHNLARCSVRRNLRRYMQVQIEDARLRQAAQQDMDAFLQAVADAIIQQAGGELTAAAMAQLNAEQVTLWGYMLLRDELMDGGFVQMIHNGYGPFFFENPFAKAMRLWGLHDFSKMLYKARKLYEDHKEALTKPCTDDEFMALFEQHPEFDDLDDDFVEQEEQITAQVACYVDEHLDHFVQVTGAPK